MGGGLPAAAFGGRASIMQALAPAGPVYQAGTLSGNPLACAAGLATLRHCTPDVYARLDSMAAAVGKLAGDALAAAGVPHFRSNAGSMFSIFFTAGEVHDYAGAQRQDVGAFRAFFHELLARGVYLPPSAYEAWFVSAALDDAALDVGDVGLEVDPAGEREHRGDGAGPPHAEQRGQKVGRGRSEQADPVGGVDSPGSQASGDAPGGLLELAVGEAPLLEAPVEQRDAVLGPCGLLEPVRDRREPERVLGRHVCPRHRGVLARIPR